MKGHWKEPERHALQGRGIRTEMYKIKKEEYKLYNKELYEQEKQEILEESHSYPTNTILEQLVNPFIIDKLYKEFKNNKEKYNIKEVKLLIGPSTAVGAIKFYIKWKNNNITTVESSLVSMPIEYAINRF